jgi:hypothetical protein
VVAQFHFVSAVIMQTQTAGDLPEISRAELDAVSIQLNPVIVAIGESPEAHRSGHVAVLCHSLLTRIAFNERDSVIAYLNRMIKSDLN